MSKNASKRLQPKSLMHQLISIKPKAKAQNFKLPKDASKLKLYFPKGE